MTLNYQNWVPQNAILDGKLETKFQAIVHRWNAKWFIESESFIGSLLFVEDDANILDNSLIWYNETEEITFGFQRSYINKFAEKLLSFDFPMSRINTADEALFEGLSKECIEDLQSELCKDFLLDSDFLYLKAENIIPIQSAHSSYLRIKSNNRPVEICIIFPDSFLAAARKTTLHPIQTKKRLGSFDDAIAEQVISMGARVGAGVINLGDVENLATGDVLVLDRKINDSISVTINNSVVEGLNCHMLQDLKTDSLKISKLTMGEGCE